MFGHNNQSEVLGKSREDTTLHGQQQHHGIVDKIKEKLHPHHGTSTTHGPGAPMAPPTATSVYTSATNVAVPPANLEYSAINENPSQLQPVLNSFHVNTELPREALTLNSLPAQNVIVEKVVHPGDVQVKEHFVSHPTEQINVPHIQRHDIQHEVIHEIPHTIHHEVHHQVPHVVHHDVKHEVVEHLKDKFIHEVHQDVHHTIEHDVKQDVNVSVTKTVAKDLPDETVVCQDAAIPHSVSTDQKVIVEPTTVITDSTLGATTTTTTTGIAPIGATPSHSHTSASHGLGGVVDKLKNKLTHNNQA
eukprot:GEZU01012229.1.p1 GENE.GEZU01012229.1~~GEZU01012229.1.p1  ORF type:complete len:304 (+),score=88.74 GEZU01012229.1:89-1000(+)